MKKDNTKKINLIIDIAMLVIIFGAVFSNILIRETTNLDEIWHYNIARSIANGLVPYRDISMITTPFMYIAEAIILRLTMNEMLIARILASILGTMIILMSYKILEKITNKKVLSICASMLIAIMYLKHFVIDYNYAILLIILIIIYREIADTKEEKKGKRQDIILGILSGLAICTKQTIGTAIAVMCIIEPIIMKPQSAKTSETLKKIILRATGTLATVAIMAIYLIANNALGECISYCIDGVKTFTNSVSYTTLFEKYGLLIKILSIILPITIIASAIECIISKKENQANKETKLLVLYSIPMALIIYPIADDSHFVVAGYTIIILLISQINRILELVNNKINNKYRKTINITIATFIILILSYNLINTTFKNIDTYQGYENINTEIAHLKYLSVPEYLKNRIEKVNDVRNQYSKDKIYILDSDASLYDIAEEKYYKNYDMFNKGNLGKNSEDGIIKNIEDSTDSYYMIRKKNISANWQTPTQVTQYIRDNLENVGEVDMYDIYYKK